MHEVVFQLMRYARGTWRYRWWMLGVTWAICLVGWAIVARLPDQYQSSAKVYVDTSSVLAPYLQGLALNTSDTNRKISLMTRTLLSRPNLEKVMRMTDLDLRAVTEKDRDEIIDELRKNLRFSGTGKANLYSIGFKNESPELAKLVVKSLLTIFMEGNLGDSRRDQDSARQFIEKQIQEYEKQIVDTKAQLIRFKQKNMGLLPDEKEGYYTRLRSLRNAFEKAKLEASILEDQLGVVRRQIEGEDPTLALNPNVSTALAPAIRIDTSSFDRRIEAARVRLDGLLLKYTERHPDVVASRKALVSLEGERKQFVKDAKRAYASGTADPTMGIDVDRNPVHQQMRINQAKLEEQLSAKRRFVADYAGRIATLEGSLDEVLSLENEYQQLNRTLEGAQKNYTVLSGRMASAELGRKADSNTDQVRFRIIEPPRVPTTPTGPNRVFLSSGVLLVALGAGLALAFLMSQIRPTYDERQTMSDALGLPVLGSVNMVWTSDQIHARKVRNVSFVFTFTGLLMMFGTVLALYQFDIDLLPRLAQSLRLS